MRRAKVPRWFDWAFVFVAMCGAFVWQLVTPELGVMTPVRARPGRRFRTWR